jgi:CubicO group peptidase (beta-lactamase class C family)
MDRVSAAATRQCLARGAIVGILAAAGMLAATVADAKPDAPGMIDAFAAWVRKYKIDDASLAIRYGGKTIGTWGYGSRTAETPVNVASLSKAITGACIARLVGQGRLSFDDRLGDLLAPVFAAHGRPADRRANRITVAHLLTHMSGIRYDWAVKRNWPVDAHEIALDRQAAAALERPLGAEPGRKFWYNNTNFAILGAIIEQITGRPYAAFCTTAVLRPSGATATLDAETPAMSSWAGWVISAAEYVKFLDIFDRGGRKLGVPVSEWPGADLPYPSHSLGLVLSRDGREYELAHQGGWWGTRDGEEASWGSYFERWADGTAYMATFAPHPPDRAYPELRRMLDAFKGSAAKRAAATTALPDTSADRRAGGAQATGDVR